MEYSNRNGLTNDTRPTAPEAQFFLAPESPLQRQYEALRCFFVEGLPSQQVATRFGYSPGAFRVLCHQFRHDLSKRARFFQAIRRGPQAAPARDRVRERAVALRKRNLSVYDIQRELAAAGHSISINALSILLREEGFARLPRRRDEQRPATLKPEAAAIADVRQINLAPRSFRTRVGGLFLFVPLMRSIDLGAVLQPPRLPGSQMIPAEQAVRTLLALKLLGIERKSHVMDRVFDEGIALFAGLNVVPKRSYLAAYSSRVDRRANLRLMGAWFEQVQAAGLPRGSSFDLDFHTVPANSQQEPLDKHYVSSRSRSQKGILVFLARDATERVLCYANAGVPRADRADEVQRFVQFWHQHSGQPPAELVFDSQLTTYAHLNRLNQQGIVGLREHGTTHRKPYEVFLAEDAPELLPLPEQPYEAPEWQECTVHRDCHLILDKCYYSVPYPYRGEKLWVRADLKLVRVYRDHQLIKTHVRVFEPGTWQTDEADYPPEKRAYLEQTPAYCRAQAQPLGPEVSRYMERILADHAMRNVRKAQAVLRLASLDFHGTGKD